MTTVPIWQNTGTLNDSDNILLHNQTNRRQSDYTLHNFRTPEYTKNPEYLYPQFHRLYDLQNVTEGQGAGMNPNLDSSLRHSEFTNLPDDRLNSRLTMIRYIDFLPPHIAGTEFDHSRFLVSTSISDNPQRMYNPLFFQPGVSARNYSRPSDECLRAIAQKMNSYRLNTSKFVHN